jgi:murein hydrolase activator
MMHLTCAFCIVISIFTCSARADVTEDLRGVRDEIRAKKQMLKKARKVESKVSTELEHIDRNLKDKEATLSALNRELQSVEVGLTHIRKEIEQVRQDAEKKKEQIRKRLSALYKAGELGEARMFFSSESLPQLIENRRYMKSVVENDRKLFTDYQEKFGKLQKLKSSLEQEAGRKEKLQGRIRQKKQEVEVEREEKAANLDKIRQEKKSYVASLKELEANARRLQLMVERLEARSRKSYITKNEKRTPTVGGHDLPAIPDKGFGAQRGRLNLPTAGTISSRFGKQKHPEFNSFTVNNGITINAPMNTDFRSVYEGHVIFADRFKGYGNMMIIDHGGGFFTLYAHATKLDKKVGATVAKNEVIGAVGDTDSTQGSCLYFEIRYQGKPVDPSIWLR